MTHFNRRYWKAWVKQQNFAYNKLFVPVISALRLVFGFVNLLCAALARDNEAIRLIQIIYHSVAVSFYDRRYKTFGSIRI